MAWTNPVRARLAAGDVALGVTISVPSAEIAARAAQMGFDFLWVEMEHSPVTLESLRTMVLATRGLPSAVFARVPVVERWTAKRVLDQGVSGVIFPFASTPEAAQTAAEACKYPPLGRRGSGAGLATSTWPEPDNYADSADREVVVISIVEELQAVENIDAIASTPGIDVLFIGTSDLSFSLGLRGRQNEPLLQEAIDQVVAAAQKHGKYVGRPARSPQDIHLYKEQGFRLFQTPTELGFFQAGAKAYLDAVGERSTVRESKSLY